ncbi:hypothetical protein WR25_22032 [Diploscapter pachys]|uniref:HD domain-containing protein n=1 Tax=Diploscapter pachys TaxID=2018661 RepID=A0A2A2JA30_9BILA|nr:hypothetical protein WR25_22032 [Diploscapter pachys]
MAEWPPNNSEPRCFADNVHDTIYVYQPLCALIDRPEFQRLRSIRQLSAVHLVYPTGSHDRFTHSLGTYHLAVKFVSRLRSKFPDLHITSAEHLCVSVAALMHDIGHGPFSHLFDGPFRAAVGGNWKHEQISRQLVESIMHEESVKEAFKRYLGDGQEYETNINFIQDLIHSKKFPKPLDQVRNEMCCKEEREKWAVKNWLPKGRDISRSFLFDIVSNDFDSHDVDKYDYMLRDAKFTGASIALRTANIDRIMENAKVLLDPDFRFRRIAYAMKVARNDIASVGEARQRLHDVVYQHLTVKIIEEMFVEILLKINDHMRFRGSSGKLYRLSEIHRDIHAYVQADDTILNEIYRSEKPELQEARSIIDKILKREIPMKLVQCNYSNCIGDGFLCSMFQHASNEVPDLDTVDDIIKSELRSQLPEKLQDDVFLIKRQLSKSSESSVHPLRKVLVYDNRDTRNGVKINEGRYLNEEDEQRQKIKEKFNEIVTEKGLRSDDNEDDAHLQFCESYVECAAVTLLEERLCLGNSRKRPYWLPDAATDPYDCHGKLKNDYLTLEKIEQQLDNKWTECLIQNSLPFDERKEQWCTSDIIRRAPRFTSGRMINYVPTKCFGGLERRRRRECGELEACCDALSRCGHIWTTSQLAQQADSIRENLKRRARECERGRPIFVLPLEESIPSSREQHNRINDRRYEPQNRNYAQHNAYYNPPTTTPGLSWSYNDNRNAAATTTNKNHWPTNVYDHDRAYDRALSRTNEYKQRYYGYNAYKDENRNQGKVVQNTLNSFLDAAQYYLKTLDNVGKISGCSSSAGKLNKVQRILNLLGEDKNSRDMKEISDLVHTWHSEVRTQAVQAKDRVKAKQMQDNIEQLIEYFDSISEKLVRQGAKFDDHDYPEEDASIAGKECDPIGSRDAAVLESKVASVDLSIDDMGESQNGCDEYLRCRSEMHLAVDGCAERFASSKVDLAESADTIVLRNRSLCRPEDYPLTGALISAFNRRLQKMRACLSERNRKYFSENVCIPYSSHDEGVYIEVLARVYANTYESSSKCFEDANLIQERCNRLRNCCPDFDTCRNTVVDVTDEEVLISRTAQFNEKRQECRRKAARDAFKDSLKQVIKEGKPVRHVKNLLSNI